MTEFTYIEHLDIPQKRKGSILHAEEYNATVDKINEIVDNLYASYEYNKQLPKYDRTPNTSEVPASPGTGVIINADGEKLYPYTDTSYVISGNKYLNDELTGIHQDIENINANINNIEIPSYIGGNGINIDENNVVSLDASYLIENVEKPSIYLNEQGKLVVNNEVVLANAESQFKFIDEHGNWVGDMANVKNYIDEQDNVLNNKIDTNINEMYTYVSKFTEYDTFGKTYSPTDEFINKNK